LAKMTGRVNLTARSGFEIVICAMPKTREGVEEQRAKWRRWKEDSRARLSAKKKANIRKREAKQANDRRWQLIDCAMNGVARVRELNARNRRLSVENSELKERVEELSKYELQFEEEPDVTDEDVVNIRASFDFARRLPRLFEVLTGETPKSFNELYKIVELPLAARNYRGNLRKRAASHEPRVSDELQLFICLLFLRQYPTYSLLILALRGLDELTLHHYIHRVLRALESVEQLQVKWPSEDEFKELLKKQESWPFARLRKVVCAVDGTEIKVGRPSRGAMKNKHYSGKKKQYSLNVLVVVRLDGVIIYCSDPQPKMQDQAFWNSTGLRERFIGKPYGIIGDGGFTFNYKAGPRSAMNIISATPHKRPTKAKGSKEKGKLTDAQKRENVEISKTRVIVENTNHRLKMYKIIGTKLRHYQPVRAGGPEKGICPALVMKVVAGLTNRGILHSPLRSIGWVPEKVLDEDLLSAEGSDDEGEADENKELDE
jgi:hypothetical protein